MANLGSRLWLLVLLNNPWQTASQTCNSYFNDAVCAAVAGRGVANDANYIADTAATGTPCAGNPCTDTADHVACCACGIGYTAGSAPCTYSCLASICPINGAAFVNGANNGCECICNAGWSGAACNVVCTPANNCNGRGTAVDVSGTCTCTCNSGWSGADCSIAATPPPSPFIWPPPPPPPLPSCMAFICPINGAAFVNDANSGCECRCNAGWSGARCTDTCTAAADCSSHGVAADDGSGACTCTCDGGWGGADCSVPAPSCAAFICPINGAAFVNDANSGCECRCNAGWSGARCTDTCTGAADCSSHGVAADDGSGACTCTCDGGWGGADCSVPAPSCAAFICPINGAAFVNDANSGCECRCNAGWSGARCTDTCTGAADCSSHGVAADDGSGACTCTCDGGWGGADCSAASAPLPGSGGQTPAGPHSTAASTVAATALSPSSPSGPLPSGLTPTPQSCCVCGNCFHTPASIGSTGKGGKGSKRSKGSGGKLVGLKLQYLGYNHMVHSQTPSKVFVSGDPAFASPVIGLAGGIAFPAADVNGYIDVTLNGAKFPANFVIDLKNSAGSSVSSINFHTSCSEPLSIGNVFGSLLVVGYTLTNGDTGSADSPEFTSCIAADSGSKKKGEHVSILTSTLIHPEHAEYGNNNNPLPAAINVKGQKKSKIQKKGNHPKYAKYQLQRDERNKESDSADHVTFRTMKFLIMAALLVGAVLKFYKKSSSSAAAEGVIETKWSVDEEGSDPTALLFSTSPKPTPFAGSYGSFSDGGNRGVGRP
eukprot:gene17344-13788_t